MDLRPEVERSAPSNFRRGVLDPFHRALQENEDWYQDLVEHSQDLLCIHDLQGRFLSMNPTPARVLGYTVEEMLRIPMRDFIVPELRREFDAYMRQIAKDGVAHGLLAVMTRSGERRIWSYHNTLRTEGVASPIVRGIAHDVTEQLRTEKLLRKTSEDLLIRVREGERIIKELTLFRALLDQSNDAVEVVDPETFRFLDANEKACSDLGYTRDEFLALSAVDINPSLTPDAIPAICEELKKSGSMMAEGFHKRKDGSTFPVEVSIKKVQLDRDYIVGVVHDLTKRRVVESQLRSSESRYRAVHNLSPIGISWVDARGRFLKVNPKFCEIVGRTEEELLTLDFQSITHPEDLAGGVERLRLLSSKEVQQCKMQKRYVRPDGSIRWADAEFVSMWPAGDDRQWYIAIVQDITDHKQADERLREFERVVENLDEMIVAVDRNYRYTLANASFLRHRQLTRDQVVGRSVEEVISQELFEGVARQKLDECFTGKVVNFELNLEYPRIGMRRIAAQYSPVEGPSGVEGAACVMRDITDSKQKELRLQESEFRYRAVHELSPVGICWIELSGRFLKANPEYCAIVGRSETDLLGRTFQSLTHPDDLAKNLEELHRLLSGEVQHAYVEKRYMRPDGTYRWVTVSVVAMGAEARVAETGVAETGVAETKPPNWLLAIVQDITERRQAEEALRESVARERSKSKELETVLGLIPVAVCIAHDPDCNQITGNQAAYEQLGVPTGSNISQTAPAGERPPFRVMENELEVPPHLLPIQLAAATGTSITGRSLTVVLADGTRRETIASAVPLLDDQGKPAGAVASSVDITALHQVTEELRLAKEKLSEEKLYLEEAIGTALGFGEIIGRSDALKTVMEKVAKVSPSNATVLLLGETGTGKELVARALHQLSSRKDASFIKMNCAAIPSGLLESELFGHEKGAFTGAVAKKLGRLELANHGTLFLDEIGEIPLALQPKLLRVLQDQEFERLGGTQTIKVNFRLLAATNRDLLQSVRAKEFRGDLYYRLNVFPITIPPLRDRRDDIPILVEHFVRKYSSRMNKAISSIPSKTMEALVQWSWPGNIRELENFVERSVILTPGMVLQSPLGELQLEPLPDTLMTLRDKERESILRMLRECKGQLGGPHGAAARLGLKRTTLQSKLTQLGIKPDGYRA